MPDSPGTFTSLVTAIVGGLAGGLFSTHFKDWITKKNLFDGLQAIETPPHGNIARARIYNDSTHAITDCWAYISINIQPEDLADWPEKKYLAHIPKGIFRELQEDRLCWAVLTNQQNPPSVNIYSREKQELLIFRYHQDGSVFGVYSEEGQPSSSDQGPTKKFRVILSGKRRYTGYLKIVNKETRGKRFDFEIDVNDKLHPFKFTPPPGEHYESCCFTEKCRLSRLG